jgi:F-type H+-transporting ATPase subunit a
MNLALFALAEKPHVSLAAEELFKLFGISVTNSMLLGVVGYMLTISLLVYVSRAVMKGEKVNKFVIGVQWLFEGLLHTAEDVIGKKDIARKVAPLCITLFFLIVVNYWLGILPFVGEALTYDGTPLFRSLNADLNLTFALAIISMIMAQIYAIKVHGVFGNAQRYLRNPLKDPTGAFEGVLEFIAEFSRGTALSLRLFGNVFAGEVLLMMVGYLSGFASPLALPAFMAFEIFMGLIQGYVFFMLAIVFTSLAVADHGHNDKHRSSANAHA